MNTFEEIEALLTQLEDGTIPQPEALKQIAEARAMLKKAHNGLGNIAKRLIDDPLMLWRKQQSQKPTKAEPQQIAEVGRE